MTRLYQYKDLEVESSNFIDDHALDVLQPDDFLSLSSEALHEILKRDSFYANELVIFRMVCRWINENQIDVDPDTKIRVLSAVRYPLMSDEELSEARKSQLGNAIPYAIQFRNTLSPDKLQFRGQLKPQASLILRSRCFPPVIDHFDSGTRMTKLEKPSIINYIELMLSDGSAMNPKMLLWGGDRQAYGYTIESSVNNEYWETIIDKSKELTRSWQVLQFEARPMLDIRITGVRSSAGGVSKINGC
ncbi:BTB/POZ domain-containing protein 9-like [Adelges cooleyi]|uniref:BTB/POZ domain-containing protein 9-like n=1 Tax=Adelges cooleyi TaxID=133065 RepID=UPI00217F39BD|nr:BTB/POZ domain-containing protein 9-like [Adelges cooleyi]